MQHARLCPGRHKDSTALPQILPDGRGGQVALQPRQEGPRGGHSGRGAGASQVGPAEEVDHKLQAGAGVVLDAEGAVDRQHLPPTAAASEHALSWDLTRRPQHCRLACWSSGLLTQEHSRRVCRMHSETLHLLQ